MASPLERSLATKEGDTGEGRKPPDGLNPNICLNPNWPQVPLPTALQGGAEPSGLFTVYLKASTGAAAQG